MNEQHPLHIIIESIPVGSQNWLDVLAGLLVPVVAIGGLCLGFMQYQINKQRLRHETYERRLAIYKSVQRYLSMIMRDGVTSYAKALEFSSDASESAFLFEPSVQQKIDLIYQQPIKMVAYHEKMYPADGSQGLPVGDERSEVSEKYSKLLGWHTDELSSSRQFFARKLGLLANK